MNKGLWSSGYDVAFTNNIVENGGCPRFKAKTKVFCLMKPLVS